MTMKQFIRENRQEIDKAIDSVLCRVPKTASCWCPHSGTEHFHEPEPRDDEERRQWILSDEGLYNFARSEGVRI